VVYTISMKKIFIAEDDPFILDIAINKLTQSDFTVSKTADGNNVVPLLLEEKHDLLLLDLMLPNKHGFEILKELRSHEALADLPVIIFSNENGTDIEEKAAAYGAIYFFKALTGTGELVAKAEELLG